MLALENDRVGLHIAEDHSAVSVHDCRRGTVWQLDGATMVCRRGPDAPAEPLKKGRASRKGEGIVATFELAEGTIEYRWSLGEDHVAVELRASTPAIESIALPGSFRSEGEACELAVPVYQGVLIRGDTGTWEIREASGGHGAFSMAMGVLIAGRSALLSVQQSLANWRGVCGAQEGKPRFCFEQLRCPVQGWVSHSVRLYPTDPSVTAACKQYRAYLKERGRLVTWQEKIARKPILDQLFGAVMAFTGYNHAPGLDYVAHVRRLKAYGFRSILLYPVRFCQYSLDFKMGGDDPVWLSDEVIAEVKSIPGALVAPWTWTFEGLDDGTEPRRAIFRRGQDGKPLPNWQIDDYIWHVVCTPYQREHVRQRLESDMQAMDWLHFDVSANFPSAACFSREHALHDGKPIGREADIRYVRELLGPETVGNRIVSSEGFVGHFAPQYDIGSVKMMPGPENATKTPVPMTMLVFHDSCVHDWWELHNYNGLPGWQISEARHGFGLQGNGLPKLKAAIDALYGTPPNVFPFGRQYGWSNVGRKETFSFTIGFDDPPVQEALREALPVAKLHESIGRSEMVDFRFLDESRSLQATRFSDGTEVVANVGEEPREADGYGELPGRSWRQRRVS